MSMRTLAALVVTAACALASPAWAQDQETGAVSVSASASGPLLATDDVKGIGLEAAIPYVAER